MDRGSVRYEVEDNSFRLGAVRSPEDRDSIRLEDARALAAYGIHSAVNKIAIINREITPGRITVVLVDEVLGF